MKKFAIIFLLVFSQRAHAEKKPTTLDTLKETAIAMLAAYGTHYALCAIHEIGHVLVADAALKAGYPICNETNPRTPKVEFWVYGLISKVPEFEDKQISAAIDIAGPICGFLGTYCFLKLVTIVKETQKAGSLKAGIKAGWQKSVINAEQPLAIRAAALAHVIANSVNSTPFEQGGFESDAHKFKANMAAYLYKETE